MPHLNWAQSQSESGLSGVMLERKPHPRFQAELSVTARRVEWESLRRGLEELARDEEGAELRHTLPEGWSIFWKLGTGSETKIFLAHPEDEEWIITIAIERSFLGRLIQSIEELSVSGPLSRPLKLSSLGSMHFLNNIEICFSCHEP